MLVEVADAVLGFIESEFFLAVGLRGFLEILQDGESKNILSMAGASALVAFSTPAFLFIEILGTALQGKFRWQNFRMQALIYLTNRVFQRVLGIAVGLALFSVLHPLRLIDTSVTWYWFIYAYLAFEFSHFIYHWLAHRVRIFWCLHATHHAPPHMNLSVSYAHFFLEAAYADIIRIGICALLGVDPLLLIIVLGIDSIWGHIIHIGEELMPDGRMGRLGNVILTPSHRRVHHSKNPLYIDKNFCNLLPIWDRVFGTYQNEEPGEQPIYGISRDIDTNNLIDVYFGEFIFLFKDIKNTSGIINKLSYLVMPPGWHPLQQERV